MVQNKDLTDTFRNLKRLNETFFYSTEVLLVQSLAAICQPSTDTSFFSDKNFWGTHQSRASSGTDSVTSPSQTPQHRKFLSGTACRSPVRSKAGRPEPQTAEGAAGRDILIQTQHSGHVKQEGVSPPALRGQHATVTEARPGSLSISPSLGQACVGRHGV